MSIPALLRDLDAAGIRLHADGDTLRVRDSRPAPVSIRFATSIRAAKPALLAELRARARSLSGDGAPPRPCDGFACLHGAS